MNISLTPSTIFAWQGLSVTNAHLGLLLISVCLCFLAFAIVPRLSLKPTSIQIMLEMVYEWFEEKVKNTFSERTSVIRVTSLIVTFFIVVLFCNVFAIFPIIDAIVVDGDTSIFKTPTSHLSLTIALTLISLGVAHLSALSMNPLGYIGNFIKLHPFLQIRSFADFGKACFELFLGILDLVGELAKVISLSARLFGNILAGEIIAVIIMGLMVYTQFLIPIPFFILSLVSGIIQALVFALLSLQYISLAVQSAGFEQKNT